MGIGFVVILLAILGLFVAGLGASILAWITARATRESGGPRRLAIWVAAAFPFACLCWAGSVFVFHGVVNVVFLHRDVGVGDGFDCPLPNGYALSFIDTTDFGTVYDPKNRPVWSEVRENAIDNVRLLQLAGDYILGASDSQRFEHFGQDTNAVDGYFLLHTKTGTRADFKTYDALRTAAQELNIRLSLAPIGSVYSKYRPTWFEAITGILLLGPPLAGAFLLLRWVVRMRQIRESKVGSA